MSRSIRTTFLTLVAAPALFATGVAHADASFDLAAWGQARSVTVRYADLNLATPGGAQLLERRIAVAIDQVCALPNAEQLSQRERIAECKARAHSQADEQARQLLLRAEAVAQR
jgi:UrcA family protein